MYMHSYEMSPNLIKEIFMHYNDKYVKLKMSFIISFFNYVLHLKNNFEIMYNITKEK